MSEKKSKKTTLSELGNKFPVVPLGAPDKDGKKQPLQDTSFSFIEWDMELEEKLANMQKKVDNNGQLVNKMMCLMLDKFCGYDFQDGSLSDAQKATLIRQTDWPNVMYMYIYLRCEEIDHRIIMDVTCPSCRKKIKDFEADLNGLEVDLKEVPEERYIEFELKRPILLDKKTVTGFKLDVSKWDAMEQASKEAGATEATLKKAMFNSSICGVLDSQGLIKEFVDLQTVIKKIKKADIDRLLVKIAENNAGPDMSLSGVCPYCETDFVQPIDWRYESFFGSSSL